VRPRVACAPPVFSAARHPSTPEHITSIIKHSLLSSIHFSATSYNYFQHNAGKQVPTKKDKQNIS